MQLKNIIASLLAVVVLATASVTMAADSDQYIYTDQSGQEHRIDRRALTVEAQAIAKEQGTNIGTLSKDDWDKAAAAVASMSDAEVDELLESLRVGESYNGLSDDEMLALRQAYDAATYGESDGSSDSNSSESLSDAGSSDTSNWGGYAAMGLLGGAGFATAAGALSRRSSQRREFSLYSGNSTRRKRSSDSSSQVSVLNSTEKNMHIAGFPNLTINDVNNGFSYIDLACNPDWDGLSTSTKSFAATVAAAWHNIHPELGNLLLTSGKRYGGGDSHHDYGEAFDVANDYFDDKSLRNDYVNVISTLGGTPLDEWAGEPGSVYAHGNNIHATTPNSDYGSGGYFDVNSLLTNA